MLFRVECPKCLELILPNQIECVKCDNEFDGKLTRIWWQEGDNPISFSGMNIYHKPLEATYIECVKSSCIIIQAINFIASDSYKGYFSFREFSDLSNKFSLAHGVTDIGITVQLLKNIKYIEEGKIAGGIKGCTAMTKLIIYNCWKHDWKSNFEKIKRICNDASDEDYKGYVDGLNDISIRILNNASEYFNGEHLILKVYSLRDEVEKLTNKYAQ